MLRRSACYCLAILVTTLATTRTTNADEKVEGFTEPYRRIELAAGEPGVLSEILVREGTRVAAHEKLGQLDTSVLERTLEIARQRSQSVGALQAAEAERDLRKKYLGQLKELRQRGNATQREIDRAAADLRVSEARVAMALEELELQQLECRRIEAQIRRREIRSPVDGVVSELLKEAGESFMANDPRVMTIVQLDRLRAKFALEPRQSERIQQGDMLVIEFAGDVTKTQALVETIAPVMDAKSATVQVTVAIDNSEERIPSGARCWVVIPGSSGTATRMTSTRRSK